MAKKENAEIELKIRVPKALMAKINDFRHSQKLDSKKQAVVYVLEAFFAKEAKSAAESDAKATTPAAEAPEALTAEPAAAAEAAKAPAEDAHAA